MVKQSNSDKANIQIIEQRNNKLGRGGAQVVSVFAFFSDNQSSNPAEAYSFSVKYLFEIDRK